MSHNDSGRSTSEPAEKGAGPKETLSELLDRRAKLDNRIRKLSPGGNSADWDLSPADRIRKWGHRAYVGGPEPETWYGIGRHQYHYLVSRGLRPSHRFLDIACGSLRLGQFLIPFLDEGNYYGLEGEESLVKAGLEHEVMPAVLAVKKPNFAYNYDFDFSFLPGFDVALAQSLFSHLTIGDIEKCFRHLLPKADAGSTFYFTYIAGDSASNPTESHANKGWRYSPDELSAAATRQGWSMTNIGEWGHPRGQKMAFVRPA